MGTAGDEAFAFRQGVFEARELRRLGVDVNFAPVLDVLTDRYSPNIGIRSYGKGIRRWSPPRRRAHQGHAEGRPLRVRQALPGKGHSPLDAHLGIPDRLDVGRDARGAPSALPRRRRGGCRLLDDEPPDLPRTSTRRALPATFSRRLVRDLLRDEVGFPGVIVSDDLEMGAIGETCPIGEAVVRTAAAGHDLLLVCHTEPTQRRRRALLDAYRTGALPTRDLEAAADRVRRLQERRLARLEGGRRRRARRPAAGEGDRTRAVTQLTPARPICGARSTDGWVVFPRFSDPGAADHDRARDRHGDGCVAARSAWPASPPRRTWSGWSRPTAEIADAARWRGAADATVLFLFDAHLYPSNRALLEAPGARPGLAVVLLRDPVRRRAAAPGVLGLTAYGFRKCQLDAVVARLAHP